MFQRRRDWLTILRAALVALAVTASGGSCVFAASERDAEDAHANLEIFSVRDFGAVGDVLTDDAVAVQAALDALPATGGKVVFPDGQYRLKALRPQADITIQPTAGAAWL